MLPSDLTHRPSHTVRGNKVDCLVDREDAGMRSGLAVEMRWLAVTQDLAGHGPRHCIHRVRERGRLVREVSGQHSHHPLRYTAARHARLHYRCIDRLPCGTASDDARR